MRFSRDPLINAVYEGIKRGVRVTLEEECYRPVLVLVCAGIDPMTTLGRPVSQDEVKWIQHEHYGWALTYLMRRAEARYWDAVRLVRVGTELARRLHDMKRFDLRVLQDAFDMIAAYYRCKHDPRGQMLLPFDELTYEQHLEIGWRRFFVEEGERLAGINWIARAILTAVAYQNTPQGHQAEKDLMAAPREEYGDPDAQHPGPGKLSVAGNGS